MYVLTSFILNYLKVFYAKLNEQTQDSIIISACAQALRQMYLMLLGSSWLVGHVDVLL